MISRYSTAFFVCLLIVGALLSPVYALGRFQPISPCDWNTSSENEARQMVGPALEGRLGSTREAFEAVYGPPTEDDGTFPVYKFDGCSEVRLSVAPTGHIESINVYSPRKTLASDRTPDPADWRLSSAMQVAANFAPRDMACQSLVTIPNPYGYRIQECSSGTLLNAVPQSVWEWSDHTPSYGSFVIVLHNNERSDQFWWINVEMNFEPEDFIADF